MAETRTDAERMAEIREIVEDQLRLEEHFRSQGKSDYIALSRGWAFEKIGNLVLADGQGVIFVCG